MTWSNAVSKVIAERAAAQRALEAARHVQLAGGQDQPRVGRVPEDRLPLVVPGEDAHRVGEQQALGGEVAADGEQAVLGQLRRREDQPLVEAEDRHGRGRRQAAARAQPARRRGSTANVSRSPSKPIVTVPPCSSPPKRISSASGSRTSAWISRASGRAP